MMTARVIVRLRRRPVVISEKTYWKRIALFAGPGGWGG
jgi:hypothetical protein